MKDIKIKINTKTRMVALSKSTIGNDGENLQNNFVFEFDGDFVNGQARLEYIINNETKYIFLDRNGETYTTPVKSFLTKEGTIDMQLVILEGTDEENVPIFKSNMFYVYCNHSINAEVEEPEVSTDWFEMANTKLTQADNLNVSANKIANTTIIDVTSKDGSTTTTEVIDGKDGRDGRDGIDGYTPIRGVDYYTESDKQEIVKNVLNSIPTAEGVGY
jgi:hypothetical protein